MSSTSSYFPSSGPAHIVWTPLVLTPSQTHPSPYWNPQSPHSSTSSSPPPWARSPDPAWTFSEEGQPRPLDVPWGRPRSASIHPPYPARPPRDHEPYRYPEEHANVDPVLALPSRFATEPILAWDVIYPPSDALLRSPSVTQSDLLRPAAWIGPSPRDGALRALTLVFSHYPLQIEMVAPAAGSLSATPFVTVWDVLDGIYQGLRETVPAREFMGLGEREQGGLMQAADERCARFPEDGRRAREAFLKVDYLSRHRKFLGIRAAMLHELPRGTRCGEVYVLEVGKSNR